ncbi:MAG: hypothetical protein KDI39_08405 [Pseudomonadales bacterium]|nr:hypothetical protein [Pseudomonadales bacterium]
MEDYNVTDTPSTEFRVNTYTTGSQWYPTTTTLSDGGFIVAWASKDQDGSDYGIYGQRYNSSGVVVGNEFQINTYTIGSQSSPDVAALNDGGFIVTWTSDGQDGSLYGVYGQRYNSSGGVVGDEFQINTYTAGHQWSSDVASLSDGGFVVTWMSYAQDGSSYGVYGQRYNSNGDVVGSEFQINTYTEGLQYVPKVTGLNDGGFVAVWWSMGQDGSQGGGVYGQRYNSNGDVVGNEFQINTYTENTQDYPEITALSDGGFIVTWRSWDQYGEEYSWIDGYLQRFDANGTPVGSETQINTYTKYHQMPDSVTELNDGGFVVAWSSLGQDGDSGAFLSNVYGQRYDSLSAVVGEEFRINTYEAGSQTLASVTAMDDGGFVIVWTSYGQDGSDGGIYGQRFDANGQRISLQTVINQAPIILQGADGGQTTIIYNDNGVVNYTHQDNNQQVDWQQLINNDGSLTQIDYDNNNSELWSSQVHHVNNNGQLATMTVINDNGTKDVLMFDTSNTQPWQQQNSHYDAQQRLDYIVTVNDNSSIDWQDEDQDNNQVWRTVNSHQTATGALDWRRYINDDGTEDWFDLDQDSSQPWLQQVTHKNAAGQDEKRTVVWDNGTLDVMFLDANNDQLWKQVTQHFNTSVAGVAFTGSDAVLDAGIAANQVWLRQEGNNLEVSLIGTGERMLIADWFSGNNKTNFSIDGVSGSLMANEVQTLVDAMAAFAPPALGQTTLTTEQQNALGELITASW